MSDPFLEALTAAASDGDAKVSVDHNYGGKDKYSYWTSAKKPITEATILIYRAADYNAGKRGDQYTFGETCTDEHGRWQEPVMLPPGDYVLYYYKQGQFGPDTANLNVV